MVFFLLTEEAHGGGKLFSNSTSAHSQSKFSETQPGENASLTKENR